MHELVLSEFTIANSGRSLYHKINSLGKFLKRGRSRYFEKIQVIVVDCKVIFRIEGSEFYEIAYPSQKIIFEVYYTDLKEALENDRSPELLFKVYQRTLQLNDRKLSCAVKSIKDDEFDVLAGLGALNFGEIDPEVPSWQNQVFKLKHTGEDIHMSQLLRDAEKAASVLKKYKISSDTIFNLILEQMK